MQYDAHKRDHGLPHDPFKALITPRPIGWISSISSDGVVNLAPYSFFNAFCDRPYVVGFSSQIGKHSQTNAEATGEFVCNIVPFEMRDAMNKTSQAVGADISEFDHAGLEKQASSVVKVPRVKGIPAALECKYMKTVSFESLSGEASTYELVLGEVVSFYIDDDMINENGLLDVIKYQPLSRLGYRDYAKVDNVFSLQRPDDA